MQPRAKHSPPKGYPKFAGLLNHHQSIGVNHIPSKHWCHVTHGLPWASFWMAASKINCCKVAANSHTNSQICSPSPLPPLRQFCTHGCCEWAHAVWWTWRWNRPRRGPHGPSPPARLFRLNPLSRGVVGGEVNHGFMQVTSFKEQRNHSSSWS